MNLGPQRIADTYQLVLNQSGSSVTLGDGTSPNWIGTTVASTTGNQIISGVKTFNSTVNANITGSAGSATLATSAISASGLFLATSDGNASSTTMYPVLFSGTTVEGNQRAHIDSTGLSYNASTNALTATSFIGNASTAATLTTSRNINGTAFNGSTDIVVEPYIENDLSTNALRYLTFVDNSGSGYQRLNNDSKLFYNPSSGVLSISGGLLLGTQTNKAKISYATNEARTLNIPAVTADSTFAFINQVQTFSSAQTINANFAVKGNLDFGSSTLNGGAASSFFKTNAGQLGTTAGNTLNLASIGFGTTNNTSLSFLANRQSNGSDWQTSSIGLTYNVDDTTGVNNQQIWMLPNGNVGLGKNNPTEKLEVQGNLKVSGSISGSNIILSNQSAKLAADVSLLIANTYYDVLSISLTSGTWLVNSSLVYNRTNTVADAVVCRIVDSGITTTYASSIGSRPGSANYQVNLANTTIITLTSTTTIKLQAYTTSTAAATVAVVRGGSANYTQMTAVRIS